VYALLGLQSGSCCVHTDATAVNAVRRARASGVLPAVADYAIALCLASYARRRLLYRVDAQEQTSLDAPNVPESANWIPALLIELAESGQSRLALAEPVGTPEYPGIEVSDAKRRSGTNSHRPVHTGWGGLVLREPSPLELRTGQE
jgi:hypothetical protein